MFELYVGRSERVKGGERSYVEKATLERTNVQCKVKLRLLKEKLFKLR
jgi:hypothetical protein